jgi:hypothetical protein
MSFPKVGEPAPDFELQATGDRKIKTIESVLLV